VVVVEMTVVDTATNMSVVVLTETEVEAYRGGRSPMSPVSSLCNMWCPNHMEMGHWVSCFGWVRPGRGPVCFRPGVWPRFEF